MFKLKLCTRNIETIPPKCLIHIFFIPHFYLPRHIIINIIKYLIYSPNFHFPFVKKIIFNKNKNIFSYILFIKIVLKIFLCIIMKNMKVNKNKICIFQFFKMWVRRKMSHAILIFFFISFFLQKQSFNQNEYLFVINECRFELLKLNITRLY